MKKILVFATHNQHKAAEIQQLLGEAYEIRTLTDIGCYEEIRETGLTLAENASIKSHYVFEKYGLNCFADDTGLEVESLNGEPGVFSARYAGLQKNDEENMNLLLQKMNGITERAAQFRTVISCVVDGRETLFEGVLKGDITLNKIGSNGFGYDPIFQPSEKNCTLAEMSTEQKNEISHRAKAMQKLLTFLQKSTS